MRRLLIVGAVQFYIVHDLLDDLMEGTRLIPFPVVIPDSTFSRR